MGSRGSDRSQERKSFVDGVRLLSFMCSLSSSGSDRAEERESLGVGPQRDHAHH